MFLLNRKKKKLANEDPTATSNNTSPVPIIPISANKQQKQPVVLSTDDPSDQASSNEEESKASTPSAQSARSTPVETSENSDQQYEVEAIWGHEQTKRGIFYKVKWKGFDECTVEPAKSFERDCPGLCKAYKERAQLEKTAKNGKGKKKRHLSDISSEDGLPHKLSNTDKKYRDLIKAAKIASKVARKGYELAYSHNWPNESTNWDEHLAKIDAVTEVSRENNSQLVAYLIWTAGDKTIHLIEELHERVPLKLISHYEENLRFSAE